MSKTKFKYVGDNPLWKKTFNDPDLYIMDYAEDGEGPITSDEHFAQFVVGPGHVMKDGRVMSHLRLVGHIGKEFILS